MIKLAPYWNGFGDLWALTSYCCLLSRLKGKPVYLSKWSTRSMRDRGQEINDILGTLDDRYTANVVVSSERFMKSSISFRFSVRDHYDAYVPTRVRWTRNASRIVACQLETTSKHRPDRFCAPGLIEALRAQLPSYTFVALGKAHQNTLGELVEILARAELFVGMDSGVSHVAHSVGVPVFLKYYSDLALSHPDKEYVAFRDEKDLMRRLSGLPSLQPSTTVQAREPLTTWQESSRSFLFRGMRRLIRSVQLSRL